MKKVFNSVKVNTEKKARRIMEALIRENRYAVYDWDWNFTNFPIKRIHYIYYKKKGT